jgi:NAD+ diphosphatase
MHHDGSPAERSALTGFAINRLDRMAERRDEADLISSLAADSAARTVVFAGDVPILKQDGPAFDPLFTLAEAAALGREREVAFLGRVNEPGAEHGVFARLVETDLSEATLSAAQLAAIDLRTLAMRGLLPPETLGILAQAKSLLYWHARHRFCSNCGVPTKPVSAGWRRDCGACGTQHFPRTDPVVIMLVVQGEQCLLGRQEKFPPGMYSCLAGFVEGGETLENAVRREVLEEAGLTTGRVSYVASQPWPFPSSLMIGCCAEATSSAVTIDRKELEDARWFSRSEVEMMFAKTHPDGLFCPPKLAIANLLLWSWARGEIGRPEV